MPLTRLQSLPLATPLPKDFTVPAGSVYSIKNATFVLTASATVGNRLPALQITDENVNFIFTVVSAGNIVASASGRTNYAPGVIRDATFVGGSMLVPLPSPLYALASWRIRFTDSAGIDLAGDQGSVNMLVDVLTPDGLIVPNQVLTR